jgi:hypothetical protein
MRPSYNPALGLLVQSWVSANPGLKFNPLFSDMGTFESLGFFPNFGKSKFH